MELLADHHARVKIIGEKEPWPGDKELCAAYNITPADILKSVLQKIMQANIPKKIFESMIRDNDKLIEVNIKDHYKITASIKYLSSADAIHVEYIKIYNIKKYLWKLTIPYPVFKLLEKDNLGDKPGLNIDPTIACKVLELGNTALPITSPLYNVAQYGKAFFINQSSII